MDSRSKPSQKPQYGTENMSHIIALLNDKSKRNTSNHVSMKKLASLTKSANKHSY